MKITQVAELTDALTPHAAYDIVAKSAELPLTEAEQAATAPLAQVVAAVSKVTDLEVKKELSTIAGLYAQKPELPKELADPNSYNDDGSLKIEFISLAINYDLQVQRFNNSLDHAFKYADHFLDKEQRTHTQNNSSGKTQIRRQSESHSTMMELLLKLKTNMMYEWVWDSEKQEKVRMLVPKRM